MAVAISLQQAWLEERKKGIGASEAGTILGINPYESPYELYLHKRNETPAKEATLPMRLGHLMEPVLHTLYVQETKRDLVDPGEYAILQHPDHPWLRATLDRMSTFDDGREGPVELKAPMAGYFSADGAWHAPDSHMETWLRHEAPLMYQAQLQIQMACSGTECGEIVALIGNAELLILPYERNDEFLDAIIPVLYEFWTGVQNGVPPTVDGSESTTRALKALHPLDNGETIQLPSEIGAVIREWELLKDTAKAIDAELKACHNRIIAAMGDNTFGVADGLKLSYKAQTRRAYECAETTFRVLRKVGK